MSMQYEGEWSDTRLTLEGLTLQTGRIENEHVVLLAVRIASVLGTVHKQRVLVLLEVGGEVYT